MITRVDEKWLEDKGMPSSRKIVKLIKNAIAALNKEGKPLTAKLRVSWSTYDNMNKMLQTALAER